MELVRTGRPHSGESVFSQQGLSNPASAGKQGGGVSGMILVGLCRPKPSLISWQLSARDLLLVENSKHWELRGPGSPGRRPQATGEERKGRGRKRSDAGPASLGCISFQHSGQQS